MLDGRVAVPHLVDRHREDALARLEHALGLREAPHERDAHHARAGPGREAHPQVGVGVEHVLFPGRITELVARVAGRRLHVLRLLAAEDEGPHERAVEPDLELVARPHAAHVVHVVPVQPDRQVVLAVDGKEVANADPAPGAERHVVARPIVLHQENRHPVDVGAGPERRLPHREPGDFASRREIALHQGRRDRQDVGHVVEAVLVDVVRRQERRHVDVERQQIPDGVGVLGAVQAVKRLRAPRVGMRGGVAVDLGLQPAGQGVVGGRRGARPARRRHGPRPELRDDLLPDVGARPDLREVAPVEGQTGRAQAVVVAGCAVAVDRLLQPDGVRREGLLPRRDGPRWREQRGHDEGRDGKDRQPSATRADHGSR